MKMTRETHQALQGSITKWEGITDGTEADRGTENCPLCALFYFSKGCDGCPVKQKTGRSFCDGSPYEDWSNLTASNFRFERENGAYKAFAATAEARAMARRELEFLQSLLPASDEVL